MTTIRSRVGIWAGQRSSGAKICGLDTSRTFTCESATICRQVDSSSASYIGTKRARRP
jgi:hypothetical protein